MLCCCEHDDLLDEGQLRLREVCLTILTCGRSLIALGCLCVLWAVANTVTWVAFSPILGSYCRFTADQARQHAYGEDRYSGGMGGSSRNFPGLDGMPLLTHLLAAYWVLPSLLVTMPLQALVPLPTAPQAQVLMAFASF